MTCDICLGPLNEYNMSGRCKSCLSSTWSDDETDRLADMIADGLSFARAGKALGRTKNSCISRWHHAIVAPMGEQAA